jgi:hypothetical protein
MKKGGIAHAAFFHVCFSDNSATGSISCLEASVAAVGTHGYAPSIA